MNQIIKPGDIVRVTLPNGRAYDGEVESAHNYGTAESPNWYVRAAGRYWKQSVDGGIIELFPPEPTEDESRALVAIYNNGLEAMGGNGAADLIADNMSWFDSRDLSEWLSVPARDAFAIMIGLSAKGFAVDSGESANNEKTESDWYLTETGIRAAADIAEDNRAFDAGEVAITESDEFDAGEVSVCGFRDERSDIDAMAAPDDIKPRVCIIYVGGRYESASIPMTAETARKLAGDLIRAADAIDNGADYKSARHAVKESD